MTTYETWYNRKENSTTCATSEEIARQRAKGLIGPDAELLYRLEAATFEEALAILNLRMGYEPYQPRGRPAPCPRCGANYYPEGSGQCWRCGLPE